MGLWKGFHTGTSCGWESPITDGPVHPALVNLAAARRPGLARRLRRADGPLRPGEQRRFDRGARRRLGEPCPSACTAGSRTSPPRTSRCTSTPSRRTRSASRGTVEEARLFGPQLRLATRYTTIPGSNRLTVRDEVINLKDQPARFQLLYHWNFGPPFPRRGRPVRRPDRGAGPARRPRRPGGIADTTGTGAPRSPASPSRCISTDLPAESRAARTLAMLRGPAGGTRASCFRSARTSSRRSPSRKNTAEPARRLCHRPRARHQLPESQAPSRAARAGSSTLPPGRAFVAETSLEVLATPEGVAEVEAEIRRIQARACRRSTDADGSADLTRPQPPRRLRPRKQRNPGRQDSSACSSGVDEAEVVRGRRFHNRLQVEPRPDQRVDDSPSGRRKKGTLTTGSPNPVNQDGHA